MASTSPSTPPPTPRADRPLVAALVALLFLLAGAELRAQTPYTDLGLGYPVPAVDARAAGMGGVAVGLGGGSFSIANPADLVTVDAPALSATLSPERVTLRTAESETRTSRNRVPLLRGVVPIGSWVAGIGFGSELDQDWTYRFQDTLVTTQGSFPYIERREQDGGLTAVDLSVARRVGPIDVGASYQYLTGNLRQILHRRYVPGEEGESPPGSVNQVEEHGYSSWRARGGIALRPLDGLRLAASYGIGGTLSSRADESEEERSFDLPNSFDVKASLRLSESWLATAGAGRAFWSSADGDLRDASARDVTRAGGGIEYGGMRLGTLPLLLRVGARTTELPFVRPGSAPADERALTLGVGTVFSEARAAVDVALEAGTRGEAARTGVEEDFLRLSFTATIRQ